jgi:uncharacterized protein YecE (DUF72 family)
MIGKNGPSLFESIIVEMAVYVGISGWQYREFRGFFYPKDIKPAEMLKFYSNHFRTVELNASFYRFLPDASFDKWFNETPDDFVMSIKANRYFTHFHRLSDPKDLWVGFYKQLQRLRHKLGPVLFQTHPAMTCDLIHLRRFLELIGAQRNFVFEFRNPSWFNNSVYELLEEFGASFCIYDLRGLHTPTIVTSRSVYVRLHGPSHEAYTGSYSDGALNRWTEQVQSWDEEGRDVYVYFDNTMQGDAIINARDLVAKIWPKTNNSYTINP